MAYSSSEERVDLSEVAAKMGLEITNNANLAKAIKAGRSCLSITRVGLGKSLEGFENSVHCGCFPSSVP